MSNKEHTADKALGGSTTKNKGESQQTAHKGAESVSKQDQGTHKKDESDGADHNTTKKGANAV